ncbi:MAG: tetratricopeptide repeat protein, partial [Deltaproteobacteria bacterium]|nr:tetratricopeptide repeat protein [Deltaproteobacteria bacterium]
DILRRQLHLDVEMSSVDRDARLLQLLASLDGASQDRDLETLHRLLDPSLTSRGQAVSEAHLFARRAMSLIARLVDVLARERPTVIVVDDLHLCDGPSLELFGYLTRRLRAHPVLLLGVTRSELLSEHPELLYAEGLERINVEALGRHAVAELVAGTLGKEASAALTDVIVERAAGNPRCVEEILRSFEDSGVAERRVAGWRICREPALPPGKKSVAQARVDPLSEALRSVLAHAAVIGDVFWLGAVEALAPPVEDLEGILDELQNRDLIIARVESPLRGERAFTFSSAALVEVAYARNRGAVDLAALHGRVAAWLSGRSELSADVWAEAGRHAALAGDSERAFEFLREAGDAAREALAYPYAATYYARAQDLAAETQDDSARSARVFEILVRRDAILDRLGRASEQQEVAAEMLTLARREKRTDWEREALIHGGRAWLNLGDHTRALSIFREAHAFCDPLADPGPCAQALRWQALAHFRGGAYRSALPLFDEARHLADRAGLDDLSAALAYEMGVAVGAVGDYAQAVDVSRQALGMFRAQKNAHQESFCLGNLGCFYGYLGDYEVAIEVLGEAVSLAQKLGAPEAEASARANLGRVCFALGQIDEAERQEVAARVLAEALGDARLMIDANVYEALVLARRGLTARDALVGAHERAARALALAEEGKMSAAVAMAQAVLAHVHHLRGDMVEAGRASEDALAALQEAGSVEGFEMWIRINHVQISLARGDEETARRGLARGRRVLLLQAARIPDETQRARFLERVEENATILSLAREMLGEPSEDLDLDSDA